MKVCFKKEEKFMLILVVNAGSSSLKYQVRDTSAPESEQMITSGLIENIGTDVPDHEVALHMMAEKLEGVLHGRQLQAIGHRVVQGAEKFTHPVLLNEQVIDEIDALSPLAPLHNPAHVKGMRAAFHTWPDLPQVAVFDTAFHSTMPEHAWRYAIPYDLADKYSIRRYGFHGTSMRYVAPEAARILGKPLEDLRMIVAHLGNGASITAIRNGKSVDTSMGFTPIEGLVMGTRCGDIDPGVYSYLTAHAGMNIEQVDEMLNKKSGLLGISELSNDCRTLEIAADEGHEGARLALEVMTYRLAKYIASMSVACGGIDALVFTGGIGENSRNIRAKTVAYLDYLGLHIDTKANMEKRYGNSGIISPTGSTPAVLVVPTNEELMIALDTAALAGFLQEAG